MSELRVAAQALTELSLSVLTASGVEHEQAAATTAAMMHASLHGVDSHGIRLLPFYADCLRNGICRKDAKISVTYPRRAAARVDADDGLGHLPTYRAMDEACTIARDVGIGMAVVVNSTHFGAAGAYTLAAAEAGLIGFVTCNSGAFVVPFGGGKPLHGTNPISLAAPRPRGGDPFLLDMATSSIPWNRVMRSRTEGLALPAEVALDAHGRYTTDPNRAVCLGPLGGAGFGYKGAGLAGLAEVLAGTLTGMRLGTEQSGILLGDTKVGHFVMAIDPATFIAESLFGERISGYLNSFSSEPKTMPAGGPEWTKRRDREAHGIPLPRGLEEELRKAAETAGVVFEV